MAARVEKLRNRSWANLPLQELSAKHQLSDKLKLIFYKKKRGEAKSFSRAFFYLFRNIFFLFSRLGVPPFSEARFQHIFFCVAPWILPRRCAYSKDVRKIMRKVAILKLSFWPPGRSGSSRREKESSLPA